MIVGDPATDPATRHVAADDEQIRQMLLALETTVQSKLQEYDLDGLDRLQLLGEEDGFFRGLAEQMLGQGGNSHDSEERLQACARMIGEHLDVEIVNRRCEECASHILNDYVSLICVFVCRGLKQNIMAFLLEHHAPGSDRKTLFANCRCFRFYRSASIVCG